MEELGRIVPRALKHHIRRNNGSLLAVIAGIWPRVAGKAIAEQSQPVAFSSGTLTLTVSSDCWVVQLRGLSAEICDTINRALGESLVSQIRVRSARPRRPADDRCIEPGTGHRPPIRERADTEMEPALETGPLATLDPETQKALSRSFAKYFSRDKERLN